MFTGIIESIGTINQIGSRGNYKLFTIIPDRIFENLGLGESIAIDGCCLTVTEFKQGKFVVEASQETLSKTLAGSYKTGQIVNLERAMTPSGRLGGHIVTGHVDYLGKISTVSKIGDSIELKVEFPADYNIYLVAKGSITINGISLTVNEVENSSCTVNIIPFTQYETAIKNLKSGDKVNLEFDILGKYVVNLLHADKKQMAAKSSLTINKLKESGW
jgi:riboflavin synthase